MGYLPIEQLKKGDHIISRPENDVDAPTTVRKIEVAYIRQAEILELTIGGRTIQTTAEHPFWVRGFGWTSAGALEADDELATADGHWIRLAAIRYTGQQATVYNIRIHEDHTYFIGQPNWGFAVWVHNTHIDPSAVFAAAEAGGKHSGFLANYIGKSAGELQRGINSLKKQIAEHTAKIADPETAIAGFSQLDPRQQAALLNSKWPGDIARQQEQLAILEGLLKRLTGG